VGETAGHTTNVFGALVLLATDGMRTAAELAAGRSDAAPAALVALHNAPRGRSLDELRRVVGLTSSGGVRLVDRLVADGLVERHPGADARVVVVKLTIRGRRAARAVLAAKVESLERLLRPLTGDERTALTELVSKLIDGAVAERLNERDRGVVPPAGWLCRLCDFAVCGRERGECPAANAASAAGGPPPDHPRR
jgi:MarR family transcriptional repressor of emrRAB